MKRSLGDIVKWRKWGTNTLREEEGNEEDEDKEEEEGQSPKSPKPWPGLVRQGRSSLWR